MMALGLIAMLVGLAFYAGFFFWVYWYMRVRLTGMAETKYRGRPVALFVLGVFGFIVSVAMVIGISIALSALGEAGVMVLGLGFVAIGATGAIGLIVLLVQRLSSKRERKRFEKEHPVPKLQLWMQDMFAAAFCFGIYMALQTGLGNQVSGGDPMSAFALSAWVLLAMGCGLYFAMDVCRRSLRLQKPIPRLMLVVGVVLATTLCSLIPVWLSWRAWRYALYKAHWVLGEDLRKELEVRSRDSAEAAMPEAGSGA